MAAVGLIHVEAAWVILAPALFVSGLLVVLSIFARGEKRPPDVGWKGIFYSNPDDRALVVPKRYGVGWTLNFGNPWSWVVLALILLALALTFILSVPTVR